MYSSPGLRLALTGGCRLTLGRWPRVSPPPMPVKGPSATGSDGDEVRWTSSPACPTAVHSVHRLPYHSVHPVHRQPYPAVHHGADTDKRPPTAYTPYSLVKKRQKRPNRAERARHVGQEQAPTAVRRRGPLRTPWYFVNY